MTALATEIETSAVTTIVGWGGARVIAEATTWVTVGTKKDTVTDVAMTAPAGSRIVMTAAKIEAGAKPDTAANGGITAEVNENIGVASGSHTITAGGIITAGDTIAGRITGTAGGTEVGAVTGGHITTTIVVSDIMAISRTTDGRGGITDGVEATISSAAVDCTVTPSQTFTIAAASVMANGDMQDLVEAA